MITVETKPMRLSALQWHKPGDCVELGVVAYKVGRETRYGLHCMEGFMRITAGDWIVLADGKTHVYSPGEFNNKFKIIEEVHP